MGTTKDLDKVGTPHFAQFVPLEDNQIGFFTVYDGSFDKYIDDFTKNIGEVFDLLFKFTKGPPPSPCRKHLQEFIDFAAGANRAPIGFYQAYPGLTVQDIHALIADSKSQSRCDADSEARRAVSQDSRASATQSKAEGSSERVIRARRRTKPWAPVPIPESGCQNHTRPRRHSGLHSPRLPDADGAAFPADGGCPRRRHASCSDGSSAATSPTRRRSPRPKTGTSDSSRDPATIRPTLRAASPTIA